MPSRSEKKDSTGVSPWSFKKPMNTDVLKGVCSAKTILEHINWATEYLKEFYITNARRNAEEILSFISGKSRIQLYLDAACFVEEGPKESFASLVKKRAEGYPLQYILGSAEFCGLNFRVLPGVFIPRPETEILVEQIIGMVKLSNPVRSGASNGVNCQVVKLLDMGTGSGNIAISSARSLSNVWITAIDISPKAVEVAKLNAQLNNVTDRIEFIQSDLFTDYRLPITDYNIIVSNPPYIPNGEIEKLQPEVRLEPRIALDGGEDGLFYIRRIVQDAPHYLKRDGLLIMEIGFGQAEAVRQIFSDSEFKRVEFIKDYQGIERVAVFYRN